MAAGQRQGEPSSIRDSRAADAADGADARRLVRAPGVTALRWTSTGAGRRAGSRSRARLIGLALILLAKIRAWTTSTPRTDHLCVRRRHRNPLRVPARARAVRARPQARDPRPTRVAPCLSSGRSPWLDPGCVQTCRPCHGPPKPIRSANSRDQPDWSDRRDARCCTDIVRRLRSPCAASRTRAAIALPRSRARHAVAPDPARRRRDNKRARIDQFRRSLLARTHQETAPRGSDPP